MSFAASQIDDFGAAIARRIVDLAAATDGDGDLTRLYLGPAHRRAAALVTRWMHEAGLATRLDAVATLRGRYEAARPGAPILYLGSHIDTVANAGRYDGTLGVLTAIEVVARLARQGRRFPFAIEILAFGDEEGLRFPSTLSGSRALAGRLDPAALDERDAAGTTRREALAAFGCDLLALADSRMAPEAAAYVELHIEQGPVLESLGLPVGVVSAINGATRAWIAVDGVAGHAGTVPMGLRRDAMAAAAEMILAIEASAQAKPGIVATVGALRIPGGAINTVPGHVSFSLDLRSPSDADRAAALAAIRAAIDAVAQRRGTATRIDTIYEAAAAPCGRSLREALGQAVERCGFRRAELPSGAGHDAMAFSGVLPFGMIFVRCRGGISHSPAEEVMPADIEAGARVLTDFIEHFQPGAAS